MKEFGHDGRSTEDAQVLVLIQGGSFTVIAEGEKIKAGAGDAILFRFRAAHGAIACEAEKPLLVLHGCGADAARAKREITGDRDAIRRARALIHARYAEELTAASLCAEVAMSYSHFSRTFRRVTGESFRKYLSRVRLAHAQRLLLTTERSVTEIALDCGFGSASYFCMQFKAHKGVSPTEYRAARRQGTQREIL